MTIKPKASILKLVPQCVFGMYLTEAVFARCGLNLTITSIYRGGSGQLLHGEGRAFDLRVSDILPQARWREVEAEVGKVLRPLGFDVILENPDNDPVPPATVYPHIHCEYDPKDAAGNKLWPIGQT